MATVLLTLLLPRVLLQTPCLKGSLRKSHWLTLWPGGFSVAYWLCIWSALAWQSQDPSANSAPPAGRRLLAWEYLNTALGTHSLSTRALGFVGSVVMGLVLHVFAIGRGTLVLDLHAHRPNQHLSLQTRLSALNRFTPRTAHLSGSEG